MVCGCDLEATVSDVLDMRRDKKLQLQKKKLSLDFRLKLLKMTATGKFVLYVNI